MPYRPLRPSPYFARLVREQRQALGLTTAQVAEQTSRLGERIPAPTLSKIERGTQEPGLRRAFALLRLYQLPPEVLPDLLELEELAAEQPTETDPQVLLEQGVEHWKRGEIGPALAHLFAVRRLAPATAEGQLVRQKALLAFAIGASNLGRTKLSHRVIEELALEPPEPSLAFSVLYHAAVNWVEMGSVAMAMAVLEYAGHHPDAQQPRHRALLLHEKARVLLVVGQIAEAERSIEAALHEYGGTSDAWNRLKAQSLHARIFLETGRSEGALELARASGDEARALGYPELVARHQLNGGRALLALGRAQEAVAELEQCLAHALLLRNQDLRFYAHYWLWKVWSELGQSARARIELEGARFFSGEVGEATREVGEIAALHEGRGNGVSPSRGGRVRRSRG